jgi:hygromycin-B 4-O-kinase
VAAPAEIGAGEAAAFLDDLLGGGVAGVEPVGAGEWSRAFGFRHGGRDLVVRFGAHRDDFDKDRRAHRWAGPDLPVPEVIAVGDGPGGSYAISTRAWGVALEHLDADGWEAVLPSLLAVLDALRAVDLDADGSAVGVGLWDGSGRAPRDSWADHLLAVDQDDPASRAHGWRAALEARPEVAALHRQGVDELRRRVPGLAPERRLVHADLVNRNVLVDGDRVTAVLDWGCALYGDPLHDVAWIDVWSPWHPAVAEVRFRERALAHLAATGADLTDADARIRASQIQIFLDALAYCSLVDRTQDLRDVGVRLAALLRG